MWISGIATALGVAFIVVGLANGGAMDGRRVIYTIIAALGLARGILLYREGLAKSQGREPKPVKALAPGNEKKVILWIVGIAVGLIAFMFIGIALWAD
jgi:hypothetical protein